MARFGWLGGRDDRREDTASVRRARAHRRSTAKAAAEGQHWEDSQRRFGTVFRRR